MTNHLDYRCEILADSLAPNGARLTTVEVCFPRMVLADMTRHRCFSYSFESTRAVPTEARIEQVLNQPFVPVFRKRTTGMQMGEELVGMERLRAEQSWRKAAGQAAVQATKLLNTEKGLAGRILEPFCWITGIISGTDWQNFFNLRCHPSAQYELQVIAKMIRGAYEESSPEELSAGEWHLPLVKPCEYVLPREVRFWAQVSAGRCASVSYLKHHSGEGSETSWQRWVERLAPSCHWSPGEHPAMARSEDEPGYCGNFRGFKQLRKFYPGESVAEAPA